MQCPTPYQLKEPDQNGRAQLVPCGACGACRHNKRTEWSFRLKEELKHSQSCYFLTLTYSDENLPHIDHENNGTLIKSDLQKFIKRLRKRQSSHTSIKIRYYAVGEYGSRTKRPHYHALIFNATSRTIEDLPQIWKLGHIKAAPITDARIHYVTKYHVTIDKKSHGKTKIPEFALMSRRPGIGYNYTQINSKWHTENGNLFVINNGYKQNIPRYFKEKMFSKEQLETLNEERKLDTHTKHWEELQRLEDLGITNPTEYIRKSNKLQSDLVKQKAQEKDQL